ncbi:uncharacterized protein LOC113468366 isoform X2 [Diaphorina citri]|uniref:Uncharacterized protein LOC113468366 isoform X1 n=1 Tax=Diaphorina citri TaxID=121845 RepID=A0A3Q0IXM8_DIACI|nr:uncharacterized protein LOC113468366 isoform X1 [Diaphorina citri]XP_026681001.1 uncharacterized protein LOC113468366 isoform X2 [Diaphorina citri]
MEQILQELKKIREDFNVEQQETRKLIEERFSTEQAEKIKINEKLDKQDSRINKLEKEARKRNVIIYGMNEGPHESFMDLKSKINWIFNVKMELNIRGEEIDEFFRLGKKNEEKRNKPIIVKMISSWRKSEIMMSKRKLIGTKIFIENDLSEEEILEKRNMIAEMKNLKAKGHEAYIKGKSLVVNTDKHKNNDGVGEETNDGAVGGTSADVGDGVGASASEVDDAMESEEIVNTTIYKTPSNTPGKRLLSPENVNEIRKNLTKESALKKIKGIKQLHRRSYSDGQKTLDEMLTKRTESKTEEQKDTSNIAYVSIIHDSSKKKDDEKNEPTSKTVKQNLQ